jgi:hypothetical protein
MFKLNKKGQAASMDALIFLSIVGIVFVFIIGYAMTYGTDIVNNTKKLYNSTYHYAALKSFMSASYGRDGNDILYSGAQDNVVTMIKEDYGANTLNISDENDEKYKYLISYETQKAVFGVLHDLFKVLPQRSYLLLVSNSPNSSDILQPLILFINTYPDESSSKSYVCYPQNNQILEQYLQKHTLDLEVAEGTFMLYRNILSSEDSGPGRITKESGSIFLASWLSNAETEETINLIRASRSENGLDCQVFGQEE